MSEAFKWQIFIVGILWGVLIIKVLPLLFKDSKEAFSHLYKLAKKQLVSFFIKCRKIWSKSRGNAKSPADGTAERNKGNVTKYSIPDYPKNFHKQNFERWE
jgi:hypothetical protein